MAARVRTFFGPLLVCWLGFMGVGTTAFAVVGMTPLRVDVYAQPGTPTPFEITVINTTPTAREVRLLVEQLVVDEDGNTAIVEQESSEETEGEFTGEQEGNGTGLTVRDLITFEGSNTILLGPNESRRVTLYATIPPDAVREYLAIVLADPGPEEMPVYGNTNRRVEITFRVGCSVFIIPGTLREVTTGRGTTELVARRYQRPVYSVSVDELNVIFPKPEDRRQVLRVEGILNNKSNTFIQPLIQARLQSVDRRRLLETIVLRHGFNIILAETRRRFEGEFTSSLEPGTYQITLEVDYGEGRPPIRKTMRFEVTEPIKGTEPVGEGVLSVRPRSVTISMRPGQASRGKITVTNRFDEPVRVTPVIPGSALAEWFSFSPKRPVIRPKASRDIRVTVRADKVATQVLEKLQIQFVPETFSGTTFPETETRVVDVTLRVEAPRAEESEKR